MRLLMVLVLLAACHAAAPEPPRPRAAVVAEAPWQVVVAPGPVTLAPGNTVQLGGMVVQDGQRSQGCAVTWSSSDPAVAAISALGLVSAVAPGRAIISVGCPALGALATQTMVTVVAP